jgi:putative hemolysin
MPASVVILPALLRAYLRLGAVVCGAPSWDVAFNVADLYILLDREQVAWRYTRRFLRRVNA